MSLISVDSLLYHWAIRPWMSRMIIKQVMAYRPTAQLAHRIKAWSDLCEMPLRPKLCGFVAAPNPNVLYSYRYTSRSISMGSGFAMDSEKLKNNAFKWQCHVVFFIRDPPCLQTGAIYIFSNKYKFHSTSLPKENLPNQSSRSQVMIFHTCGNWFLFI